MNVLVIGGTRFIGPCLVRRLLLADSQVTVFHRGKTESPLPTQVRHIHGDFNRLEDFRGEIEKLSLDVVVHMRAMTRGDAETFMRALRGTVARVVVPSSQDVYRAYGRLHKTEPGPPDSTPLTEDSPLREKPSIHGEAFEKIAVEQVVMGDPHITATVLRYPAVYGPGDYRMYDITRRMLDERPAILLDAAIAPWRWTHAYVEDIAAATVLAVLRDEARGRIYNCGEVSSPTMIERIQHIGKIAGWNGKIVTLPIDQMPPHMRDALAWEQDWIGDSTRIRNELGFAETVSYDESIRAMIDWHRANPKPLDPKAFDYPAEDAVLAAHA